MMERIYALAEADIDTFVGTNRANLITLSNLFPKTKLRLHQNVLKILGEDQAVEELMHVLSALEQLCRKAAGSPAPATSSSTVSTARPYRPAAGRSSASSRTSAAVTSASLQGRQARGRPSSPSAWQ